MKGEVMKKVLLALIAGVMVFAITGCAKEVEVKNQGEATSTESSSAETTTVTSEADRQDIKVVKSGYWIDEYENGHYGVILENPNQGWVAENFQLIIKGLDASGNVVGSATDYVDLLCSNGQTGFAGDTYISGATTLEFSVVVGSNNWTEDTLQQAEYDEVMHVDSVNATSDEYGYLTVAGEATNGTESEFNLARISAIFFDDSDNIVGGAYSFISTFPAGSTMPFSIPSIMDVPTYSSIKAYIDSGFPTN